MIHHLQRNSQRQTLQTQQSSVTSIASLFCLLLESAKFKYIILTTYSISHCWHLNLKQYAILRSKPINQLINTHLLYILLWRGDIYSLWFSMYLNPIPFKWDKSSKIRSNDRKYQGYCKKPPFDVVTTKSTEERP